MRKSWPLGQGPKVCGFNDSKLQIDATLGITELALFQAKTRETRQNLLSRCEYYSLREDIQVDSQRRSVHRNTLYFSKSPNVTK